MLFRSGFEVNSWYGFMAPPGTPKEIVGRLNAEAIAALKSPEVIQVLKTAGLDVEGTSPEAFAQKIRDDLAMWKAFIKESGIKSN